MPDPANSGSKSGAKSAPNFYSAVGGMDKYANPGESKSPAKAADDSGEKVKNVTTLLEVLKKMDALESDPENKKLLESAAQNIEQYMAKLQPGAGGAGKDKSKDAGAGAGAGSAGGAGATVGDNVAASAAM